MKILPPIALFFCADPMLLAAPIHDLMERIDSGASAKFIVEGYTMEGAENTPIVYELFSDMIWSADTMQLSPWLRGYTKSRYGHSKTLMTKP